MPKYNPDTSHWSDEEDEPTDEYLEADYVITNVNGKCGGGIQHYECETRCGATIELKNKYGRPVMHIYIKEDDSVEHISIEDTPHGKYWDDIEIFYKVPDNIVFANSVEIETDIADERMELRADPLVHEEKVRELIAQRSDNPILVTDVPIPYDDPNTIDEVVRRWLLFSDNYADEELQQYVEKADQVMLSYLDERIEHEEALNQLEQLHSEQFELYLERNPERKEWLNDLFEQ